MNRNLLRTSRLVAGFLAVSILPWPSVSVVMAATTDNIAPSYVTTQEGLLGDLYAPNIEAQIKWQQETYNKTVEQMVTALGADQSQIVAKLKLKQEAKEDTAVKTIITKRTSLWQRLGQYTTNLWAQITGYFAKPSQASEDCREGGEVACNQAKTLAAKITKATQDQQNMKDKFKQAVSDWGTSNRQAYEKLSSTSNWETKCYDSAKRFCYKQNGNTIALADGSLYNATTSKSTGGHLVGVSGALQKNGIPFPGTTQLSGDQKKIEAARDYINALGPTLEDKVMQKFASIACSLGVMNDGLYQVKKGKVYFKPNPADNLCTYPWGSDKGQAILRSLKEWARQTAAYMRNVGDNLARNYQKQRQAINEEKQNFPKIPELSPQPDISSKNTPWGQGPSQ